MEDTTLQWKGTVVGFHVGFQQPSNVYPGNTCHPPNTTATSRPSVASRATLAYSPLERRLANQMGGGSSRYHQMRLEALSKPPDEGGPDVRFSLQSVSRGNQCLVASMSCTVRRYASAADTGLPPTVTSPSLRLAVNVCGGMRFMKPW